MTTKTYIPLGSKLLVQLPGKDESSILELPEGVRKPGPMTAKVLAVGGAVNDQQFTVNVGDTVVLSITPVCLIALNKEERLIFIERCDVAGIEIERPEPVKEHVEK